MPYVMSFVRIAKKEGRKEGKKEGLKEGLQKGSLLILREVILEALGEKFGEIPPDLSDIVNKVEDKEKLKMFHRLAIRCASLEEYRQMLQEKV